MNPWRVGANLATLANALVGVGAIVYVLLGNPLFAMLLIMIGIGFDGLDGQLSRRTGGPGRLFGRIADSVADAITFGAAPAVLLADHANQGGWGGYALAALAVGALYLATALARLVRFTLLHHGRPYFLGVPTPMAALTVAWLGVAFYVPAFFSAQPTLFLGIAVVVALLMIAPWPFPKIRRENPLRIPMIIAGIAAAGTLVPFQFRPGADSPLYLVAFGAAAIWAAGLLLYFLLGPWSIPPAPRAAPVDRGGP